MNYALWWISDCHASFIVQITNFSLVVWKHIWWSYLFILALPISLDLLEFQTSLDNEIHSTVLIYLDNLKSGFQISADTEFEISDMI